MANKATIQFKQQTDITFKFEEITFVEAIVYNVDDDDDTKRTPIGSIEFTLTDLINQDDEDEDEDGNEGEQEDQDRMKTKTMSRKLMDTKGKPMKCQIKILCQEKKPGQEDTQVSFDLYIKASRHLLKNVPYPRS